jgi:hypothetical protein
LTACQAGILSIEFAKFFLDLLNENEQLPALVLFQSGASSQWARAYPRSSNSSNELF